jgi:hypothetical protein
VHFSCGSISSCNDDDWQFFGVTRHGTAAHEHGLRIWALHCVLYNIRVKNKKFDLVCLCDGRVSYGKGGRRCSFRIALLRWRSNFWRGISSTEPLVHRIECIVTIYFLEGLSGLQLSSAPVQSTSLLGLRHVTTTVAIASNQLL